MCTRSPSSTLTRVKEKSLGNLIVYSVHGKREAKHWGHMLLPFGPWKRAMFPIWEQGHQKYSYSVHVFLMTMLVFFSCMSRPRSNHLLKESWSPFSLVAFSKISYRKKCSLWFTSYLVSGLQHFRPLVGGCVAFCIDISAASATSSKPCNPLTNIC